MDNSYFNDELFWGSKQQTVKKIAYAISIGAMSEDTILVSIMYVNNEVGAIEPVEEIGKYIKSVNKNV